MKAARLSPVEQSNPQPPRAHQLSPSAWNRYETCPRMYWLSRQRLPRKAGMAASLGTAVHASIEDLLNMDLDGRSADETGWLPLTAEGFLKTRWDEEKAAFMATPRRPDWKDAKWSEAKKQQKGGIVLLLDHIGAKHLGHEQITVALWRHLQSLTIAVEGELVTSDGRLMGRLDLLFADVDDAGQLQGWLVADLKTGNAPTEALKPEVNRQLRMYRDILLATTRRHRRSVPRDGTRKPPPSGRPRAKACSSKPMRRGKPRSRPRCQWTRRPARAVAVVSVTGKRGALTGGPGAKTRAPSIKATFATLSCSCIATKQLQVQRCSSCVSRWTNPGAPFPPASKSPLDLTGEEKRSLRPFETAAIRAPCS